MKSPLIVALDFAKLDQALLLADQLDPKICRVKIGQELFTAEGPLVIKALQKREFEIFLDLKFHDIPNTVASAVLATADLGVWMTNIHALGGRRMMEAAADILEKNRMEMRLIAVTVLTSMAGSEMAEVGIVHTIDEQVEQLAQLAQASGLDGVVCSAHEAKRVRQCCGNDFLKIAPGVRPANSDQNDQKRVTTPTEALANGCDYIVIGRPITTANEPAQAVKQILQQINQRI